MKKVTAIQTSIEKLNELLGILTDEGKLVGLDEECESWNNIISFIHGTGDFLDNKKTREILAEHFDVDRIVDYLISDEEVLLIFDVENI